jgi:Scramblase/Protein of unknown function (DUF2510)
MSTPPAAWHPDPMGRAQLRYWDGSVWTDHVSNEGVVSSDALAPTPSPSAAVSGDVTRPMPAVPLSGLAPLAADPQAAKIQAQIQGDGWRGAGVTPAGEGGGSLFTEAILVVNQKAKFIEVTNQYSVYNSTGVQIGAVNEVGQSTAKKVLRVVSNLDQFMTHKYEVHDANGLALSVTRPRKVFKSTVVVENAHGQELGRIVQENMIGKIHFALTSGGQTLGSIKAENWRAWNFRIEDASGTEIARITKTFEGVLKAAFTTADNYVLQIHHQLPQPLHSLVVAAALCVDTALKQDSK